MSASVDPGGGAHIRIGTSGYSYKDWVGPFYPPGTPQGDYLSFYAGEFRTTELNFTFYRLPDSRTLARIVAKVGPGFAFAVKATRTLTHELADDVQAEASQFVAALAPVVEAGEMSCILAQFPYSFKAAPENHDHLKRLRERLGDLPVAVEFRHDSWVTDETFDFLRQHRLSYCCVDQPRLKGLLPPVAVATAPVAYVRFHGRNAAKWWQHEEAWERYDYTYSRDELSEWVPKIRTLASDSDRVLIYMNNHWQGQAIESARQMRDLLGTDY
jgi:uncharacterized protein YecE (DUF72 family)